MTGELNYDLQILDDALSQSTVFQEWCDVDDGEDAKKHIDWYGDRGTPYPYVVLSKGAGWKHELESIDGIYSTTPQLIAEFVIDCDFDDSNRTVFSALMDDVSEILADLKSAGYLPHAISEDSENTPRRAPDGARVPDGEGNVSRDWASLRLVIDCPLRFGVET